MVALSFCASLLPPGGWPWVRHFAFPVIFVLVVVPWPVPLEQFVIQNLMQTVAGITVEIVGILNIPALQHGNVIQISNGLVGVDEACSGVRSLQTTLFASLFLGELYRLSVVKRFLLTMGSLLLALLANLGRTVFLVWSAARNGLPRMHDQHDTAGMVALVATLAAIFAVAWWIRPREAEFPAPRTSPRNARALPGAVLVTALLWMVAVEAATEWWYRAHETRMVENLRWTIQWPTHLDGFAEIPLDDTVHSMLRYTAGREVAWRDEAANQWMLFLFRWPPGRNSAQLAHTHTPDICLRGVGYTLDGDVGMETVEAGGLKLPFRQSVFKRPGEPALYVFYCLWEERGSTASDPGPENGTMDLRDRLQRGRRRAP